MSVEGSGSVRDFDEANSKRDVLLIILTPGVRLNERRSQTREAQCKFNYREEEAKREREASRRGRARGDEKRQRGCLHGRVAEVEIQVFI